ncbi:MAG: 1-acyl-sn-glycerol-3-phosphate acyltransferase [Muribaculaceae bacterium]|nr:1-acyl-sn-glycerol-3-phosphate acyltransferase [Muribaculaceae bacterium]
MVSRLLGHIMKNHGWKFVVNIPDVKKCVICVAPHTSNWDFIMGELASRSVGMKARFLMKDAWFFFPLKYLLRALGGIPVSRDHRTNVTGGVIDSFNRCEKLAVAVTPEGTRSLNPHWHKGFLYIARDANVPIVLGYFNYDEKIVCLDRIFAPSDDVDADMLAIKRYYDSVGCKGKYPEKFTTGLNDNTD